MREEIRKSRINKTSTRKAPTERKKAKEMLWITHRFLVIANRHAKMNSLIKEFVTELKSFTGCAAVGIRILDEEGNIPYQAYDGFSQEFYESESPLSINSTNCMCINVIKGMTNPNLSFYTQGGSFYINGTTRFLTTVSEEAKGQTRNVCNQFGYESVALVPIRVEGRILGLIHVADPRENIVSMEILEMLEAIAMQLGTAIQRVWAEEKIQEQNRFLRNIIEALSYPFYVINANDYIIEMSNSASGLDDVSKRLTCYEVIHRRTKPCKALEDLCPVEEVKKTKKPVVVEHAHYDKKGNLRYFEIHGYPIFDNKNNVVQMIEYFFDITERKMSEEKIKNLAKFPSENPYPVLRIAKDGTVLYANAASLSFLDDWGCQVGQSVPVQWRQLVASVLETSLRKNIEVEYQDQIFSFVIVPVPEAAYVNIYGFDITERKRAEEALKYSEERYALAQRAANIGSWDWDIRTGNLQWSEKIEPMFGFTRGEFGVTYEAFLECVHPEDRQYVIDSVNACIEEDKEYDIEHRIVWPNGLVRWVSETGNVIRDENNKAVRMLGVVRDVTERKKVEEILRRDKESFERLVNQKSEELLRAQKQLEKAKRLSDIGTLAATVAHELRNPLGVIRTAAYNIRRKRQNISVDKHLANIEKKISESGQIINNLLSYSRIKMPHYEKIQIYNILNECITSAKNRFYKQKVSIDKRFESLKKKVIEADPFQIREIFGNIINNAYQAIENKKGKIEVRAKHDGRGSITISFKDNGIGIDKEDLKIVFEPFFTRKSKGTGLGLTICNGLVNLHGGRIDIESKKGKTTTVTVSLPSKRKI